MTEKILQTIRQTVENAVKVQINGQLVGLKEDNKQIKEHLKKQDATLERVEELLEDKDFLVKLWAFMKFIGGVVLAILTALALYFKIK